MEKYQLNRGQIDFLFKLIDNYLRNSGLQGLYNVLDILRQLNNRKDDGDFSEIELDESIMNKLYLIFDVNLKTMGLSILDELYLLKSSLVKISEKDE